MKTEDVIFQQIANYYSGTAEEKNIKATSTYQKTIAKANEIMKQLEKGQPECSFDDSAFCPTIDIKTKRDWVTGILQASGFKVTRQDIDFNEDGIKVCTIEAEKIQATKA